MSASYFCHMWEIFIIFFPLRLSFLRVWLHFYKHDPRFWMVLSLWIGASPFTLNCRSLLDITFSLNVDPCSIGGQSLARDFKICLCSDSPRKPTMYNENSKKPQVTWVSISTSCISVWILALDFICTYSGCSEVEKELGLLLGKRRNQSKKAETSNKFQMLVEDVREGVLVNCFTQCSSVSFQSLIISLQHQTVRSMIWHWHLVSKCKQVKLQSIGFIEI